MLSQNLKKDFFSYCCIIYIYIFFFTGLAGILQGASMS